MTPSRTPRSSLRRRLRRDPRHILRRELADYRTVADHTDLELLAEQSGPSAAVVLAELQRQAGARLFAGR